MTDTHETSQEQEQNQDQIAREQDTHDPSQEETENNEMTPEDDDGTEQNFVEGEKLTFVRVRFPGNARSFPFLVGDKKYAYGQKVLAVSDRGMSVGYINSFPYEISFHKNMLPIRSINKAATQEDMDEHRGHIMKERQAEKACIRLIEELKLDMNITHVEFTEFGKKAVFYFNAPSRVDFRELVKRLVSELKIRVELRQISVRDRTAALGAIGVCGLQTCCSSFLRNYGNVSIKMAKNQNLALIPSKINGVCGQLKCCLRYEDDVYSEKRRKLPKEGTMVEALNGDRGKVLRLQILVEQFDMLTDQGQKRRYTSDQFDPSHKPPKDWRFPTEFRHIVDETYQVIGLAEEDKPQKPQELSEQERLEISQQNLQKIEESETQKTDKDADSQSKPRSSKRRRRKPKKQT